MIGMQYKHQKLSGRSSSWHKAGRSSRFAESGVRTGSGAIVLEHIVHCLTVLTLCDCGPLVKINNVNKLLVFLFPGQLMSYFLYIVYCVR